MGIKEDGLRTDGETGCGTPCSSPPLPLAGQIGQEDDILLAMRRADIVGPRASLLGLDALFKGAVQVVLLRAALSLDGLD